jgi:hypothetical protein
MAHYCSISELVVEVVVVQEEVDSRSKFDVDVPKID